MASRSDSNGRERLYKFKSRSGGVEERSKSKRLQDKKKREELTMKNRGVLNEIQQDGGDREAFKKQQAGSSSRQDRRKEELKEWKKQRDMRMRKEKKKQKPVFKVGGTATRPAPPASKKENTETVRTTRSGKTYHPSDNRTNLEKPSASKKSSNPRSRDRHVTDKAKTKGSRNNNKTGTQSHDVIQSHDSHVTNVPESHDSHMTSESEPGDDNAPSSLAWVPGAMLTKTRQSIPNFDKVFHKTFSPFKFTGSPPPGETMMTFTFRKDVAADHTLSLPVLSNDSLEEEEEREEDYSETIPTATSVDDCEEMKEFPCANQALSDSSIEEFNNIVAHNNDYTNQQMLKSSEELEKVNIAGLTLRSPPPAANGSVPRKLASPVSTVPPPPPPTSSSSLLSLSTEKSPLGNAENVFEPFRRRHFDVTERFTGLCEEWEKKLEGLVEQECRPTEEVVDDIRTSVCQAKLLMRQKLKQYLDLVELAEDPKAEHRTTPGDLQGFWDMVYFQVEAIDKKFLHFADLEKNQWVVPMEKEVEVKSKPRRSKRRASQVASTKISNSSATSERLQAARAKREAARSKLREMKLAAATKTKDEEGDDAHLSSPPKKRNENGTKVLSGEETPLEDLISFSPMHTPQKPLVKTPKTKVSSQKRRSVLPRGGMYSLTLTEIDQLQGEEGGAFMTKMVPVKAPKRLVDGLDPDVLMSPARRSKRLAVQESNDSSKKLPTDIKFNLTNL